MYEVKFEKLMPFKLHNKLYFVGSEAVSVHLIDTEKGIVLVDTGYPDMYELILENISKLGFDPAKIAAIFHTHGHIDHFGCTERLVKLSSAKTYISRIDNDIANGTLDLSWAEELGLPKIPFFDCDVLIEDGDVFDFGDVKIRCVLTPGHTDGTLSFFITVTDGDVSYIAAMHGGMGRNSMESKFLRRRGLSFDCRRKFIEGLHRVANERVDLVLGNHPGQSKTLDKMNRLLSGEESVLDAEEWQAFISNTEKSFLAYLETDPE